MRGRWEGAARAGVLIFVMLFAAALGVSAADPQEGGPRGELRGLWVVRDALGSPESIDDVLVVADMLGMNALFVQVNGRAEAYYRSDLVPPVENLPHGFDPLQYVIDGARERGMEVHAWVNAFTAGMLSRLPNSPQHVLQRHPEWVLYHRSGRSLWDFGEDITRLDVPAMMLEPGLPEVQDYVTAVVMEIVECYDVDGVHLDYLRYPSPDYGYHPRVRASFEELVGVDPLWLAGDRVAELRAAWGSDVLAQVEQAWREWRRRQVTEVMRRIYYGVGKRKPWVKVSAAVFPGAERAKQLVLQDWAAWLEEGIVDAVVPMAYTPDERSVGDQLAEAVALAGGERHVYGGLGVYRLGNRPDLLRAIVARTRDADVQGLVLFSYNSLRRDLEMMDLLAGELLPGEARVPAMPWKVGRSTLGR